MTSVLRGSKSRAGETVDFIFSDITLDKVPFCHKTFSLYFRYRVTKYLLDPTPVENFCVRWSKRVQFQRCVTRDSSGGFLPSIVELRIDSHAVSGTAQRSRIGSGKIDLAQLQRTGSGRVSVPVQSPILESSLQFEVAVMLGDSLVTSSVDSSPVEAVELPVVRPFLKNSWFSFKSNPELIDQDALTLVEASIRPSSQNFENFDGPIGRLKKF
jgi:hypothetical protein